MELKVGDKLFCKRNMTNKSKHLKILFKRNKWYTINHKYDGWLSNSNCSGEGNKNSTNNYIDVENEKGNSTIFKLCEDSSSYSKISRYFYTKTQIRRKKLENIERIFTE